MALIILESGDMAGKTTLFNFLRNEIGVKPIITPRKPGPALDFQYSANFDEFLLNRAKDSSRLYMLDRHTPSNYAYGYMRKEPSPILSKYKAQWLDFVHRAGKGLCTIWLTRQPKPIEDDLITLTIEQDEMVLSAYAHLAELSDGKLFNVVDKVHNYTDILNYLWLNLQFL